MATDVSSVPVNGNYAPHQGYGGIEQPSNYIYGSTSTSSGNTTATMTPATAVPQPSTTPAAASTSAHPDIPKDEVGWYFVEQYYTTLSRSPEKLYLFYNKRSQFVSGQETDKVPVCIGQRAINDRIKEQDFQDCKVRVTNVDSQASDSNIVIQVIGEISNKSQPHKKFTQTFVLATQTNGYFVLNDIFRYLVDEEDEPEAEAQAVAEEVQQVPAAESGFQEPPPTITHVDSKNLTSSNDPAAIEHDAQQVDREIEEKVLHDPPPAEVAVEPPTAPVNGAVEPEVEAKDMEDAPVASLPVSAQATTPEPAPIAVQEPEVPAEPEPTPSPSPPKQATPQPPPAAKPPAAKTWASMAASANRSVATPAAPPVAPSAVSQSRPTPPGTKTSTPPVPTPSSAAPPVAPTAPAAQRDASPTDASAADEWTAVGGNHNRQQSRHVTAQQYDGPITRAFIKNVHEGIDYDALKAHLGQYGEVVYYDINRLKNSANVEFKTPEGYIAAVNGNPHYVSGEALIVEERKYGTRGNFQGGRGRGAGNQGQPRGNYQGGRGGGYQPRGGRGNASAPRGRGGSVQAA